MKGGMGMFTWVTSNAAALTLTISENAITLNAAAAAHFSDTRYVMIGIDEKSAQIAVRPLTKREVELKLYPADACYKLTLGKGYARVTSKSVVAQLSQAFHRNFDRVKLDARFDEKERLLIAEVNERGDEV